MINRREALLGISAAALSSMTSSASALSALVAPNLTGAERAALGAAPSDADAAAAEDRLRKELAQMASRADSEEGVPVLLACVNQVVDKATGKVPPAALSPWNAVVVADFRQTAAAWQRVRPNATEGDVGSLIQVLAVRDFAAGGKERKS
jgi:hypothetical protein